GPEGNGADRAGFYDQRVTVPVSGGITVALRKNALRRLIDIHVDTAVLLMQFHQQRHLRRRHDDLDGIIRAAERERRHSGRLAEGAGVIFYRVVALAPFADDSSTFRRVWGRG